MVTKINNQKFEALLLNSNNLLNSLLKIEDLNEFCNKLCTEINTLFENDVFFISTYDKQNSTINFISIIDENKQYEQHTCKINNNFTSKVIQKNEPILINRTNESLQSENTKTIGNKRKHSNSLIFIPIRFKNDVIGVISIQSYTINKYQQLHVQLLNLLAYSLARHIYKLLYEKTSNNLINNFEEILDNLNEGVIIVNSKCKIIYFNKWCKKPFPEISKNSVCFLKKSQSSASCRTCLIRMETFQKSSSFEIISSTGQSFNIAQSKVENSEKSPQILMVITDITKRKEIDRKKIVLDEPIKTLGEFMVKIKKCTVHII